MTQVRRNARGHCGFLGPGARRAGRQAEARLADGSDDRQNEPMQYGVILTSGDPRAAAELAAEAEAAGWDGVFTFDAIAIEGQALYDPWVVLAAMAMRTDRVRLGAMVFAPARRRPWGFAHQAITLDILSNGRLVLPVGLGALDDKAFGNVGEPTDAADPRPAPRRDAGDR